MRSRLVFLFVVVPVPLLAASPSFDCDKATGKIPALLCKDDGLAQLDRKMADTYEPSLRPMTEADRNAERAAQRRWIAARDACASKKDVRRCVDSLYESRITDPPVATRRGSDQWWSAPGSPSTPRSSGGGHSEAGDTATTRSRRI